MTETTPPDANNVGCRDADDQYEASGSAHIDERHRHGRLWQALVGVFFVSVVAAIVIALLPSGYLIDAPGNAISTSGLVTVPKDVKTFSHPGDFRLVTVSETSKPAFGQAFVAWLDRDSDVFPRVAVVGTTPRADELRYQAVLMQNAKLSAIYKAMRVLGLPAKMTGGGVFVDSIVDGSPAQGVLAIGDTITKMNDTSIFSVADVSRFMNAAKPGERVELVVDRMGVSSDKKLHLRLGSTKRDGKQAPLLGIYMETRPDYQFPFDVGFDTGEIGGPSAGLSLTLSLIDKLSPKGLAKGNDIAVTGTINADGSVGPIGGVRQKVAAVRNAGSHYFLVPLANAADACVATGDPYTKAQLQRQPVACGNAKNGVRVIPVASLDDALAKLAKLPPHTGK